MWVTRGTTVLISVALLTAIVNRLDLPILWEVIREADWGGLLVAISVFGLGILFGAWRWHLMLRLGGNVVHPGATLRGTMMGHCFHTFVFGAAGGDVLKSGVYARWYGLKMSEVLAAAPLDRFIALGGAILFGLTMIGLGGWSGGLSVLEGEQWLIPLAWLLLIVMSVAGVTGLIYRWRGTRFPALDRFRLSLQSGGKRLWAEPMTLSKGLLAAFCVHACLSFTMVASLASLARVSIPWLEILWLFPVISMISGLPVSVGGAGLREGAALVLLGFFQIPAEQAVAAALFVLAISFSWCLVGFWVWSRGERRHQEADRDPLPETISVVIPTLNEAFSIPQTLSAVQRIPQVIEVLIADGGSHDGTQEIARLSGATVVESEPGRGTQMRAAARQARGDVVWLLHADTAVEEDAGRKLLNTFRDSGVVGGAFWKVFDEAPLWMRGSRFRCLVRCLLARRMMGDQAIFVRRKVLDGIGGVPDLPLMEEFELCRLLRKRGRLVLADGVVVTSARRFRGFGALRTYGLMWIVTLRYYLGTPVHELAQLYSKR